jgi:hypothetical protein
MASVIPSDGDKCVYVVYGYVAYEESVTLAVCSDYLTCRQYMEQYTRDHPDHDYDRLVFDKVRWVEAAAT